MKNIIITGTSRGIGLAVALQLAKEGHAILAVSRNRAPEFENIGNIHFLEADITLEEDRKKIVSFVEKSWERVDILINNAGVGDSKRFLDYSDQDWDAIVGTNLKAPWMCAQEVVSHMVKQKVPGAVINITSILSETINLGVSPYCASKAGLKHLTEVMAVEVARFNIRVNAIAPGYMVTEINKDYLTSEAGQAILKRIPMRRFVEFSDLNGALLLLASEAGRGMTGVEIKVDCGHSCSPIS